MRGQAGANPRHQFSLRSSMDFPHHLQFDCSGRFVDELPARGVPGYFTMDARLGWKPHARLELSLVGQNLLQSRHKEFIPSVIPTEQTEVERAVYGKVTWTF